MNLLATLDADVIEPAKAFLGNVLKAIEGTSADAPELTQAQASLAGGVEGAADQAKADLEAALPAGAKIAANAVLAMLPGGAAFDPFADSFIDAVCAELQGHRSTPQVPAPAPPPPIVTASAQPQPLGLNTASPIAAVAAPIVQAGETALADAATDLVDQAETAVEKVIDPPHPLVG